MTIAIGTGAYAGLSGLSDWRRLSNDASFAKLNMHDLRVTLSTGSSVRSDALTAAIHSIPSHAALAGVEERLIAPTQVDASTTNRTIVTPGRLIGIPVSGSGTTIDTLHPKNGRALSAQDDGQAVAALEYNYAHTSALVPEQPITIAGGHRVQVVGQVMSPEYFIVTSEAGAFGAAATFAVTFMPLTTVQVLTGQQGRVNDAVVRLVAGADQGLVQRELQQALATSLPNVGAKVLTRRDNDGYRVLYDDIAGDQEIYNIFALILLAAGTFAAFNLASRIVESQRRELGVGMALGVAPRALAIRPLLLGVQIAVLGVALGIPFGIWVGDSVFSVFQEALPLPVWRHPFQVSTHARGALLGVALPLLATALPTWRAIRMSPITAVQAGFRNRHGSGLAPLFRRVPTPGGTLGRMPLRNLVRAPRRTLLTIFGVAAAITTVVGVTGMVDSFLATVDRSRDAITGTNPDRLQITLGSFTPLSSPLITGLAHTPGIARTEPAAATAATLIRGQTTIDVALELMDAGSDIWRPHLSAGSFAPGDPGIVITAKAAADLGVVPGDAIVLEHPQRLGTSQLRLTRTRVTIAGIDRNPIRVFAYMDRSNAPSFGLQGVTNLVNALPTPGADIDRLTRDVLTDPGVASVERVAASSEALAASLNDYTSVLRVIEVVALALALLIAFNSASIAADERAREHATLFAFGVPLRTVLRNGMIEGGLAGAIATAFGVALGVLLVKYIVTVTTPRVAPDLGATVSVSPSTILLAAVLGIVATAAAPLLTARKLLRMDVPSTLRVVE